LSSRRIEVTDGVKTTKGLRSLRSRQVRNEKRREYREEGYLCQEKSY
jgi:hypothetical protein